MTDPAQLTFWQMAIYNKTEVPRDNLKSKHLTAIIEKKNGQEYLV